ncbi:MAG: hypothetical protein JWP44_3633 [Mucilaginibacter sp.]|nr:hypothetical protein [Mucilaginibacter sp.]
MKFFRLDLLTLLISLFILSSCKNQDTLGLGLPTANQANGGLIDTSTIYTNTVLDDSVSTSGALPKNPLAYFNDPVFGVTQSDLATDLNLPASSAYTLPIGTLYIDSVRLVLKYANGFYGDSLSSKYKVNVYQLNEKYNTGTIYYNTKKWSYNSSNLLGSLTFNARSHDSIKITRIIKGAPDTLYKVVPQIRIPIAPSFINNNFFNASSTTLASNAIFTNNVRGLYITIDKSKTTGAGGIIMFTPADSLAIYYRAVNGATIDTNAVYLSVNNLAASITHTYTTTIQTELSDTITPKGSVYLQGLGGLRARIKFPHLLANLRNSLKGRKNLPDSDIILNRAELVVSVNPGSNIPYTPASKLTMYKFDLAHQRSSVEDAVTSNPLSGGVGVFGGFYNNTTNQYHFVITNYLQNLLLKKTVDYGTFIAPIDIINTTSVDIAPTSQVGARTVAAGGTVSTSPYKMKLNIIYTKVAK